MILVKKLRWKNFLSTGNVFTEIDLDKNNTTLIVGENGAGKSTILDALSYSFFGKAFRKINKPQLINTITQKNMVVEVEFSIGSNQYKIVRGIKPNIFEVYQNDSLLNQSAEMKDYQEILEKQIIKVNHKSFCQVVVLGTATFQPFMQLSAGQRREIIEDLLDLQIFTTMNSLLKDKISANNEKIYICENEKKLIDEKIKLIKQHISELQNNNAQLIDDKKQRIEETEIQIKDLYKDVLYFENCIKDLSVKTEDYDSIKSRLKKLETLQHKIEANKSVLKKELNFFHDNDDCPICKQSIEKNFKSEAIKERDTKIVEIDEGLTKLLEQQTEIQNKIETILTINNEINDKKLEIHQLKSRMSSLHEYKEKLLEEINNLKVVENSYDDSSKLSDLEKNQEDLKTKLQELSEEKLVLNAASLLLKDGGIKSRIIKQYIPVINKLINKYLSSMEFMCQFELDETFKETIKSRYRDEFSYESFSEGEKMRINLAILFTWRAVAKLRNSINTNILIMDEVFDSSLDANGTEEFLKLINDLTSDTNTFIISHKTDQLYDKFDKVIRFEKHKNFSRIV